MAKQAEQSHALEWILGVFAILASVAAVYGCSAARNANDEAATANALAAEANDLARQAAADSNARTDRALELTARSLTLAEEQASESAALERELAEETAELQRELTTPRLQVRSHGISTMCVDGSRDGSYVFNFENPSDRRATVIAIVPYLVLDDSETMVDRLAGGATGFWTTRTVDPFSNLRIDVAKSDIDAGAPWAEPNSHLFVGLTLAGGLGSVQSDPIVLSDFGDYDLGRDC